jgi:hypothetical protein
MDVITLVWAWRIFLPCVMALLLLLIARECIPRHRILQYAAAVFTFALIPCCYDLVTDYPIPQLFINRVFTNIEYPLSMLMALLCLRFQRRPSAKRGVALTLASAAVTYLRTFLAIAWILPVTGITILLLFRRRLSLRAGFLMLGVLMASMVPWVAIDIINKRSPLYLVMVKRCIPVVPYQIHPHVILYLVVAVLLGIAGIFSARRFRPFLFLATLFMAIIPFVGGLFWFNGEIVLFDRLGMFYWVALSCAAIVGVGTLAAARKIRRTPDFQKGIVALSGMVSLVASCGLAYFNGSFRYDLKSGKPVTNVTSKFPGDQAYVTAYNWIRANTPADALFINDDGYDWSLSEPSSRPSTLILLRDSAPDGSLMKGKGDLFQIVTRRRQIFSQALDGSPISNEEFFSLQLLHEATLGYQVEASTYKSLLRQYRPTHILWRKAPIFPNQKSAPVPRGYGAQLKAFSTVLYADDVCEVWKINYP